MKLGLQLGYWPAQPPQGALALAREAERLGYDSVWTGEAWGSDAFTPLVYVAARTRRIRLCTGIAQISARTPAATAMHARTLDQLCGGRFALGLGVSGPQVVEGWYGQPFGRPLARTREYVARVRSLLGRDVPIYLGAEGPKNVALAVEIADGWLPLYYSPFRPEVYAASLGAPKPGFEIAVTLVVAFDDDVSRALAPVKAALAFYVGGMGARSRNFHKELMARMGYEAEAQKIQDLFAAGKRGEAIAAVPDAFADEISLAGPRERVRERLAAWRDTRVTTLICGSQDVATLRGLAELAS